MDSTQLQAEVTALRLERDMRQMAEARNAELLQQRELMLAAASALISANDHPKNGDDGGASERAEAWIDLRAAIAAVEQDHSGDATDMAAEIERLRPLADEVQAARHVMREHNRLLVELAASQAREQQLQEAVRQNHEWHNNYDEYGGYPESELAEVNEQAIALPQDTSAMEALIARAGEVMRERCAHEADPFELKNALATDIAEGIRALPGVTLEDLQK